MNVAFTKPYAMRRLLEHGALTSREAIEITRWNSSTCRNVLSALAKDGYVHRVNEAGRSVYRLAKVSDSCAFVRERNNCAASNVRAQEPRWTA